jgi:hypothetical protein
MLDQFAGGGAHLMPYDMKVVMAGDSVAIVTYDVVPCSRRESVRLRATSTSARFG